jgi:hypothetical protein
MPALEQEHGVGRGVRRLEARYQAFAVPGVHGHWHLLRVVLGSERSE